MMSLLRPDPIPDAEPELHSVSWNQDYTCFSAGTTNGFRIYSSDPFKETFRRDDLKSGKFKITEMLFTCNILALVGSRTNTSGYKSNIVVIWDDHQSRSVGEFSFRSEVRGVKLRRDRVVVVLKHRIYVFDFVDLRLIHQLDTVANPRGVCCLSHDMSTSVLACPGTRRGRVRVEHFGLNVTRLIDAHDSEVACLALTMDGMILATASVRGTLIRIFNTMDGNQLQEVRRGVDRAYIYSIALSSDVRWLAVSSDKGTVHIFSLRVRVVGRSSSYSLDPLISQSNNSSVNPGSSLSFMKGFLPKYFSSEWSFARFHLPGRTQFLTAFGSRNNAVMVVGMDGSFYRCSFDQAKGGSMVQLEHIRFLEADIETRPT